MGSCAEASSQWLLETRCAAGPAAGLESGPANHINNPEDVRAAGLVMLKRSSASTSGGTEFGLSSSRNAESP